MLWAALAGGWGQHFWRLALAAVPEGSSEELQSGGTQQAAPHASSEITLEPLALAWTVTSCFHNDDVSYPFWSCLGCRPARPTVFSRSRLDWAECPCPSAPTPISRPSLRCALRSTFLLSHHSLQEHNVSWGWKWDGPKNLFLSFWIPVYTGRGCSCIHPPLQHCFPKLTSSPSPSQPVNSVLVPCVRLPGST